MLTQAGYESTNSGSPNPKTRSEGEVMFRVNVDKPTKKCTIHKEECRWVLRKETSYKGIGEIKRDGGWFGFASIGEAEDCQKEWEAKGYIVQRCGRCFT